MQAKLYFLAVFLIGFSTSILAQGDSCATAAIITGSGTYMADGPSTGNGVNNICGLAANPINADWYVYTPTFSGVVEVTSCITGGVDTQLSLFTGTCGALTCVASNDDGCLNSFSSSIEITVTAGQVYYIQWDDGWNDLPFEWQLLECFGSVLGTTYLDQNSNSVHDVGEPLKPVMLEVDPGALNKYSQGNYAFCSDSGSYQITVTDPPLYHSTVPTVQNYSIVNQGDLAIDMDFAFQPIPGIYDASVDVWGWNAWIGNNTSLYIHFSNIGTEYIDGDVVLNLDNALSFVSSTSTPNSTVGQTITWNIAAMQPGTDSSFYVTVYTDSTTAPNASILNTVDFNIVQTDIDLSNNHDEMDVIATTSFDPNEKLVETETITPTEVANGRTIEYTVHFQNTGNAPAVNVVIKDSLDSDWDISTFEMIGASHSYTLYVDDEVAIWTFANIFLPDSASDMEGSNGGFQYRMAPKSTLMLGDELTNRADIYFDFNAPVLTNTTITSVDDATGITDATNGNGPLLYPVPSTGAVNLLWEEATIKNVDLMVLDALGRTVHSSSIGQLQNGQLVTLDLGYLPNGVYTFWLSSTTKSYRRPMVIRR